MESRSKLTIAVVAILVGSLVAFCVGLLVTVLVIVPVREGRGFPPILLGEPTVAASPSAGVGPLTRSTPSAPGAPAPTPTYSIALPTPTPQSSQSSPVPAATFIVTEQPTTAPPPTATQSRYHFYYVEGSRVEELQCTQPYLQGFVKDAGGAPLNGVTIQYRNWNNLDYAVSGDSQFLWQQGEFKFTYWGDPGREAEFVLQVVESKDNPVPLSEPLQLHYAGCDTMGQITNIVFRHY